MPFTTKEKEALLALKGVGPAVIARLEQIGLDLGIGGSRVYLLEKQPQARAAINAAIELAKSSQPSVDCF